MKPTPTPEATQGEKPKPPCNHVHDHVVCAGRGAVFNVYRCRYCGEEEWL